MNNLVNNLVVENYKYLLIRNHNPCRSVAVKEGNDYSND